MNLATKPVRYIEYMGLTKIELQDRLEWLRTHSHIYQDSKDREFFILNELWTKCTK